jgi:aryl-alcohol dehydrogenase-like predicted oxidoreductase
LPSDYSAWRVDEDPTTGRFGDSRLAAIADGAGIPLTELALRWLAGSPDVAAILLGGSRIEHLRQNIGAVAAGSLPDDVLAACAEVGAVLRGPMPAYHR